MLRVTYGLNVASDDDSLISLSGETMERLMHEGPPGACTVDLLPIRKYSLYNLPNCIVKFSPLAVKHVPAWFPGGGFKKRMEITREHIANFENIPFERCRAERVSRRFVDTASASGRLNRKEREHALRSLH